MPQDLHQALKMARRALAILERQAAGYTSLTIPTHLQIELEEKRAEVARLAAQDAADREADREASAPSIERLRRKTGIIKGFIRQVYPELCV